MGAYDTPNILHYFRKNKLDIAYYYTNYALRAKKLPCQLPAVIHNAVLSHPLYGSNTEIPEFCEGCDTPADAGDRSVVQVAIVLDLKRSELLGWMAPEEVKDEPVLCAGFHLALLELRILYRDGVVKNVKLLFHDD